MVYEDSSSDESFDLDEFYRSKECLERQRQLWQFYESLPVLGRIPSSVENLPHEKESWQEGFSGQNVSIKLSAVQSAPRLAGLLEFGPETASAKKSPAKKSPAKKSPAKKSPAKKSPAKESPAKKSPAKKSPERRPVEKPDQDESREASCLSNMFVLKTKQLLKGIEHIHLHPSHEFCSCIKIFENLETPFHPEPTKVIKTISNTELVIKINVKYFSKKNIFVRLEDGTISVEATEELNKASYRYHQLHFLFSIPSGLQEESLRARIDNQYLIIEAVIEPVIPLVTNDQVIKGVKQGHLQALGGTFMCVPEMKDKKHQQHKRNDERQQHKGNDKHQQYKRNDETPQEPERNKEKPVIEPVIPLVTNDQVIKGVKQGHLHAPEDICMCVPVMKNEKHQHKRNERQQRKRNDKHQQHKRNDKHQQHKKNDETPQEPERNKEKPQEPECDEKKSQELEVNDEKPQQPETNVETPQQPETNVETPQQPERNDERPQQFERKDVKLKGPKSTKVTKIVSQNEFKLSLNVNLFSIDDIAVQLIGDKISIEIRRESHNHYEYHELHNICTIPTGLQESSLFASLHDGMLTIQGMIEPLSRVSKQRIIPWIIPGPKTHARYLKNNCISVPVMGPEVPYSSELSRTAASISKHNFCLKLDISLFESDKIYVRSASNKIAVEADSEFKVRGHVYEYHVLQKSFALPTDFKKLSLNATISNKLLKIEGTESIAM